MEETPTLIIRNGTIIDGSGDQTYEADIEAVSYTHLTLPTNREV